MKILHLKHTEIDYQKWDLAINRANNRLIYAVSWFLDIVSPDWEALVSEDYDFVMPLPVKKKWGVKYLVQPVLTQQLGIFYFEKIDEKIVDDFIQKIPYLSYEIHLNEKNSTKKIATERLNLLLDLTISYEHIFNNYSKNTKRNLIQSNDFKLLIDEKTTTEDFLQFYENTATAYKKNDSNIVRKLLKECDNRGLISIFMAKNENKSPIAAVCILHSFNRLVNILPISNKEGKEKSAMFLLLDLVIKQNAGSNKFLDFEGSMIEGIARFYRGFGAKKVHYGMIKRFRPKFLIGKI